ncbi:MAG TPA: PDZ domain-containing protein [Puia sp.]
MKKIMYKIAGAAVICLAFTLGAGAQETETVPPAPPVPPAADLRQDLNDNQSEIIIRQKGDKDGKVTIEIRNGNFFLNGKPLEKFDDPNIEIEKKIVGSDDAAMLAYASPFRGNYWNQQMFDRDMQEKLRTQQDMQMKLNNRLFNTNSAFLGVSSRRSETGGATVLEVTGSSPAEKAGIKKGDVITKVNDEKIESPENLFESIHQFKAGDKVKITFKRGGREQTVSVVLEKSKNAPFTYEYKNFYKMPDMPNMPGMESPLWGPMPPRLGIKAQDSEDGKGVNVLEVTDGSPAEKAGLKKGDIITQFEGNETNNADELIQQVRDSRDKFTVKVKVLRDGKPQELNIKIPRKLKTAEL